MDELDEQYPGLIPTLYPDVFATVSSPFGALDTMLLAFQTLPNIKTPAISGSKYVYLPTALLVCVRGTLQAVAMETGPWSWDRV